MLFTEWNLEDAIAVAKEETWDEAWDGCVLQTAKNMLAKGYSVDEVIGITELPSEQIMALR
ncbi:hypothetical protein R83H12_02608 [Fibrobacteria bacterium R8-3-H12]